MHAKSRTALIRSDRIRPLVSPTPAGAAVGDIILFIEAAMRSSWMRMVFSSRSSGSYPSPYSHRRWQQEKHALLRRFDGEGQRRGWLPWV